METSAGIILTHNKKLLLCHPTNASMLGTWSIPKGHIEAGEELIEAAYRETLEEIGLKLDFNNIDPDPILIEYSKKGTGAKVYKKLYCFHYEIKSLDSLGITEVLPFSKLQQEEVDCAAFFTKENCEKYMFWRLQPVLKFL